MRKEEKEVLGVCYWKGRGVFLVFIFLVEFLGEVFKVEMGFES